MDMNTETWIEIEHAYARIVADARITLVALGTHRAEHCKECKEGVAHGLSHHTHEKLMANTVIALVLSAVLALPGQAAQSDSSMFVAALERIRDECLKVLMHNVGADDTDIPPAFRRAFDANADGDDD